MECQNLECKSFKIVLLNNFEATNIGKIKQEKIKSIKTYSPKAPNMSYLVVKFDWVLSKYFDTQREFFIDLVILINLNLYLFYRDSEQKIDSPQKSNCAQT